MKIPLSWLKQYIKINKSPKHIADSFTVIGLLLDKPIEHLENGEVVLDLEHRMDRADWLSVLGCARDLAAYERLELIHPETDERNYTQIAKDEEVKINVSDTDFVNRFKTRIFKNLTVKESPEWLKNRLEAYGIPSKNNIVDITNYVMVELGQPMHAHDIDKMQQKEITFRKANKDEKIITLLGEEVLLDETITITSTNNVPTGIGGIVGGQLTAVDENTKQILLDSGSYNQTAIRRNSRKLKIQNETVLRYDKFLHPHANELAINRATKLILEVCGPEVEIFENGDYYPKHWPVKQQKFTLDRLEQLSGMNFETHNVEQILNHLHYKIIDKNDDNYLLEVPYFRTDVQVEDDVVADVLRINDYNNIPITGIDKEPPVDITPTLYYTKQNVRAVLSGLGLHEHITDPMVKANETNKAEVKMSNSLSSEKNALRTSIYQTLEPVIEIYKKHGIRNKGVFEIGRIYKNEGNVELFEDYVEEHQACVVVPIDHSDAVKTSMHTKTYLATTLKNLGVPNYKLTGENTSKKAQIYYETNQIGELFVDSFSLNLEELEKIEKTNTRVKSRIVNQITEDMSLVLEMNLPFGEVYQTILAFDQTIVSVSVVDSFMDASIGEDKKALLVRLVFEESNLGMDKVNDIKDKLLKELKSLYGIVLR